MHAIPKCLKYALAFKKSIHLPLPQANFVTCGCSVASLLVSQAINLQDIDSTRERHISGFKGTRLSRRGYGAAKEVQMTMRGMWLYCWPELLPEYVKGSGICPIDLIPQSSVEPSDRPAPPCLPLYE